MDSASLPTRRQLFNAIGLIGGTAAIYNMMTTFGHAAETQFTGPPNLQGARKGASVIVLGAGCLAALQQRGISRRRDGDRFAFGRSDLSRWACRTRRPRDASSSTPSA